MSTVYTPDPSNEPTSITIPSDGDGPIEASDVNPGFQGLADMIAAGRREGKLQPALNILRTTGSLDDLRTGFYAPNLRHWIMGNTGNLRYSDDEGRTWSNNVVAGLSATEWFSGGASKADGRSVFATRSKYVYTLTPGTPGTPARVQVYSSTHLSGSCAAVAYCEPLDTWVWATGSETTGGSTAFTAYRSTDAGATWTVATSPPGGLWTHFAVFGMAVTADGRVIAVGPATTPDTGLHVATSDDGGDSWILRTSIATAIGITGDLRGGLSYDPFHDRLIYAFANRDTVTSEVWSSDDRGVTWTKKCALTTTCITQVAPVTPKLWIAIADLGAGGESDLAYSIDAGAHWFLSGIRLGGEPGAAYAGNGGAGIVVSNNGGGDALVHTTMRVGGGATKELT